MCLGGGKGRVAWWHGVGLVMYSCLMVSIEVRTVFLTSSVYDCHFF